MKEFEDMIKDWTVNKEDSETEETCPWMITTNELATQKSKVNKTATPCTVQHKQRVNSSSDAT